MKVNKKLLLSLSFAMALSVPTQGFAEKIIEKKDYMIDPDQSASLTIYKYDQSAATNKQIDLGNQKSNGMRNQDVETALESYAISGVEFSYLKIGNMNLETVDGRTQIVYDLLDGMETILALNQEDHLYTLDELNAAMVSAVANVDKKNQLEEYLITNHGQAMPLTNAQGYTSVTGLEQGLMLVAETKVPESVYETINPFLVSLPMMNATNNGWNYDVYAYPKNQTNHPTLEKLVGDSDDRIFVSKTAVYSGEYIPYKLVSKIPTITSKATYLSKYNYVDQLSTSLEYVKELQAVTISFFETEDEAKMLNQTPVATWSLEDENALFQVTYTENNEMNITMTDEGLKQINENYSDYYIAVDYFAHMKNGEDIVLGSAGNENIARLTYSRTNATTEETIEDDAIVYSYGLHIEKEFADRLGDFSKVQFVLYDVNKNFYVNAEYKDGKYYVDATNTSDTAADAMTYTPDENGNIYIEGIDASMYTLEEIQTDQGYALLGQPIQIDLSLQGGNVVSLVNEKEVAMTADGDMEGAYLPITVINSRSPYLPQTGGTGLIVVMGAAAAVMITAIVLWPKKKKDEMNS